ncbi:MAG: hypothetical protein EPO08_08340 [Rhodospirillaceae bacterium]|nr:MAG: hypothetical protein EPO08_08340 [Rhodospirillaceae bacterium]
MFTDAAMDDVCSTQVCKIFFGDRGQYASEFTARLWRLIRYSEAFFNERGFLATYPAGDASTHSSRYLTMETVIDKSDRPENSAPLD